MREQIIKYVELIQKYQMLHEEMFGEVDKEIEELLAAPHNKIDLRKINVGDFVNIIDKNIYGVVINKDVNRFAVANLNNEKVYYEENHNLQRKKIDPNISIGDEFISRISKNKYSISKIEDNSIFLEGTSKIRIDITELFRLFYKN